MISRCLYKTIRSPIYRNIQRRTLTGKTTPPRAFCWAAGVWAWLYGWYYSRKLYQEEQDAIEKATITFMSFTKFLQK